MYFKLIKVFFKENFSFRKLVGTDPKKSKGKAILIGFLLIYGLGAFLFTFGLLFFNLGDLLNQLGLINILLIYGFIYSTALSVMFVLFRANGYLFNYKDYELLSPLPIKSSVVILAKMTVMFIFIYMSLIIFLAPIAFSYFYHGGFSLIGLIYLIIGSFTIPLIPTIIFSFIALVIARITSRFRKSNILNIVLMFIFFFGIMYLSFSINNFQDANPLLNQQDFMNNIGSVYPSIKWFVGAVNDHKIFDLLLLLVSNIGLFVIFIFGIQRLVLSTNQRSLNKITRKNNKAVVSRQKSIIPAISSKEGRKFMNTPIYALNIGFGPVIMVVLGIASIFFADKIMVYFSGEFNLGIGIELMVLVIVGFSLSMVYSTAVSLSLEGKNFWILKSLPIEPKTIMHGKMVFNILLGLPAAIFCLIMFKFTLDFSAIMLMVMILFATSLSLTVTAFGSIVNLFVPKFDYRNPTEVVKQSAGALFGLFGSWIILVINALIYYLTFEIIGSAWSIALMSLFNLILFIGMMIFINRKTESLFIKFEV